jgi:hypothetical protein
MTKKKNISRNEEKSKYKLISYEITDEPLIYGSFQRLPQSIKDELEDIHPQLTSWKLLKKDSTVISRLEELVETYPDVPFISNYLVTAYSIARRDKVEKQILKNYENHPDYLFARVHYAEQCLDHNKPEKFKDIFKEGDDLGLLYPNRKRFHISEYVAFSDIKCRYNIAIGNKLMAELVFEHLEKVVPDHPATKNIRRILRGNFFSRLKNSIFGNPIPTNRSLNEEKSSNFWA